MDLKVRISHILNLHTGKLCFLTRHDKQQWQSRTIVLQRRTKSIQGQTTIKRNGKKTPIGIGTAIADRPSHTTKHTDRVLRRFG